MDIFNDKRVVLTLDAGGTNFEFNAFRGGEAILSAVRKDANADQLDLCIKTMKEGFQEVMEAIEEKPVAIQISIRRLNIACCMERGCCDIFIKGPMRLQR